jgi:hypothetical protein
MITTSPRLSFNAGDSVSVQIAIYAAPGVPASLTAPTGDYLIAASATAASALISKTASFAKDNASGLWTMTAPLSSAETAGLAPGQLWHQARVTDTDGTTEIILSGSITVKPTIPAV